MVDVETVETLRDVRNLMQLLYKSESFARGTTIKA